MEEFQIQAMETSPHPLDQWFWYVDDSELKCKKDQSDEILTHLNNIKPDIIEFTKEDQVADVLPMLDLKQKNKQENEASRVHGSLQENTYQHQHKKKIESSSLCEESHHKRICRQGTGIV